MDGARTGNFLKLRSSYFVNLASLIIGVLNGTRSTLSFRTEVIPARPGAPLSLSLSLPLSLSLSGSLRVAYRR